MRNYTLLISLMTLLLLAACGGGNASNDTEGTGGDQLPKMVEVEVLIPESIQPNEEVTLEALVTQGDEKVEDANEVLFEVWKQGQEADHEMIEANNDGDGLYSIKKTFEEEGFYFVVAHTTARDLHVMPRVEVTVGNPDASEREEEEHSHHDHDSHGDEHHEHHDGHDDHHHDSTLTMTFEHGSAKVNEDITLTTEIKQENGALTDADVRFEVWHENSDKHEFIVAEEKSPGVYEAKATVTEAGLHHVQIHVEKDDLHEHQMEKMEVE